MSFAFTVWKSYASSVDDGLGELVVVALEGLCGGLERVPDLFAALEGRRRVPEFIALAPQLPVRHRVIALPFGLLPLQGLVAPQCHYTKGQEGSCEKMRDRWGASPPNDSSVRRLRQNMTQVSFLILQLPSLIYNVSSKIYCEISP